MNNLFINTKELDYSLMTSDDGFIDNFLKDLVYTPMTNFSDPIYQTSIAVSPTDLMFDPSLPLSSPTTKSSFSERLHSSTVAKKSHCKGRRSSCNDIPYIQSTLYDNEKVYKCSEHDCQQTFKRLENLKRHVRSIHSNSKPFRCHFLGCGKSFKRSDNLTQHQRTHKSKDVDLKNIF